MADITIVTAFFDIGRGNSRVGERIMPEYFIRSTDTYFEYFSHMAKLENDMVIFTTEEFKERILSLRKGYGNTNVVIFDFHNRLPLIKKMIAKVQQNPDFIKRVNSDQIQNIEYWFPEYVLVNQLKTYFVNKAIYDGLTKHDLVAWVDFGYCRSTETLGKIKKWQYDFDRRFIHLFSIEKKVKLNSYEDVLCFIFNNQVYLIGGCIIGTKEKWLSFLKLLYQNQKMLLKENIIDDDQGIYAMCLFKKPELFQINYLGKEQWFSLFKKYDKYSKISLLQKIKDWLI